MNPELKPTKSEVLQKTALHLSVKINLSINFETSIWLFSFTI